MTGKEFDLKYQFNDVGKLENLQNLFSPEEKHFGVKWRINIQRKEEHLAMYLYTNVTGNQEIHADLIARMFSKSKGKTESGSASHVFEKQDNPPLFNCGWAKFIGWKTLEDEYLNDGKLDTEVHVRINKMVGFPREELRSFGEEMKEFSDVILKVEDRKFHVSKLSLATQSPYFATLFLGQFQESGKAEIELKDINPVYLQYYLEIIYAENGIDEENVEGILKVSDMYDTQLALRKCEEFLVGTSKMELKKKLELSGKYRLEELKKACLEQIKTKEDIRLVAPEDPSEMDHKILAELFKKALVFN